LLLTIGKPVYKPISIPTVKGNATTSNGTGVFRVRTGYRRRSRL
jgi:hypothetical protein